MALSDNGKEVLNSLITEFGKWIIVIAGVLTLWIQQHNQHAERVKIETEAAQENNARLDNIAKEVKDKRPLVFGVQEK